MLKGKSLVVSYKEYKEKYEGIGTVRKGEYNAEEKTITIFIEELTEETILNLEKQLNDIKEQEEDINTLLTEVKKIELTDAQKDSITREILKRLDYKDREQNYVINFLASRLF